jgi:hypothetical protein
MFQNKATFIYQLKLTLSARHPFQNFSTPVFKMWIIQEPNNVALWNKRHFEGKKTEIMQHVKNIQCGYLLNKYLKGAGLVAWEAAEYIYSARTESVKILFKRIEGVWTNPFRARLNCLMSWQILDTWWKVVVRFDSGIKLTFLK